MSIRIKITSEKGQKVFTLPGKKEIKEEFQKKKDSLHSSYTRLKDDIKAVRERDPAAKTDAEVLTLYSGLHATVAYRAAHALHQNGHEYASRFISQTTKMFTGVEIHPGATIGKGLFIDHGTGVVIGETAVIGDNCTLYQGVTLGGTGKETM